MALSHVIVLLTTMAAVPLTAGAGGFNCSVTNRLGKSLQHIEPPPTCRRGPADGGAAWCDTPGADYPWQEIREYLRRSSEAVSKRAGHVDPSDIQRLLLKYGLAKTRVASRKSRSADVISGRDVTGQQFVREAGRVTSRSGGWDRTGTTGAPSVTETTNVESLSSSKGGSRSRSEKPPSKRINDKKLSQQEELAVLFSYFTNPTNVVFTEGVLEGLLRLEESFESAVERLNETTAPPAEDADAGASVDQQIAVPDRAASSAGGGSNASQPTEGSLPSDDATSTHANRLNITGQSQQPVPEPDGEAFGDSGNVNATAGIPESSAHSNPESNLQSTPQSSHDSDLRSNSQSNVNSPLNHTQTSNQTPINPPSPPPPPPAHASPISSAPPSVPPTTAPPPLFPDTLSRHPEISGQGAAISAEAEPAEETPTGTRTGAGVLAEIRTGDDILADITAGGAAPHWSAPSGASQGDGWGWDHPQLGDWTRQDPDQWTEETLDAEVQYYLPSAAPSGAPAAADSFQWYDSPEPQWRPLPPLVDQSAATPAELPANEDAEVPWQSQRKPTTVQPTVTEHGDVLELHLVEETVYTDAIYRPGGEGEVPPPAAATTPMRTTTTTTATPSTVATTTLDPYVVSACQASVEIRSPFYAMNTQNVWKMLINIPPFETYIHMEYCVEERSQGGCADGCRCTQRHTVRTMPVYERDANGCDQIYMDKFLFPSHCDCMCLPAHHVLFNLTRPAATTPTPVVAAHDSSFTSASEDGSDGGSSAAPSSEQPANSTLPERGEGGASVEALKAAGLSAARVVTAAPTLQPVSRRAPGSPPPRQPVVPVAALVHSHRNRNRGPSFPPPLRRYSSASGVPRRGGRSEDMPPALPR